METRKRSRALYFVAVVVTIAAGLASRRFPGLTPACLGKYPGDALWALMVFFGWGTRSPKGSTLRIALAALLTCYLVELVKLYQAPWIVAVRHSTLGHLVFGHAFSWQNIIAYAVGVLGGVAIEYLIRNCGTARTENLYTRWQKRPQCTAISDPWLQTPWRRE